MDDTIELDVYEDDSIQQEAWNEVQFPCIFIEGVTTNEEISFFRERGGNAHDAIAAYCMVENTPVSLGTFELNLRTLLMLRSIYSYKVLLMQSREETVEINLDDADVLIKFIRLTGGN